MSDPIVRIVRRETLLSVLSTVRLETSHVEYLCKKAEAVKALESRVAELQSIVENAQELARTLAGIGNSIDMGHDRTVWPDHAEESVDDPGYWQTAEWCKWVSEQEKTAADFLFDPRISSTPEQSRAEIEAGALERFADEQREAFVVNSHGPLSQSGYAESAARIKAARIRADADGQGCGK